MKKLTLILTLSMISGFAYAAESHEEQATQNCSTETVVPETQATLENPEVVEQENWKTKVKNGLKTYFVRSSKKRTALNFVSKGVAVASLLISTSILHSESKKSSNNQADIETLLKLLGLPAILALRELTNC